MTTSDPTGGGSRDPFELLLDLALYAPVGAAITLRHELPKHVKQGRQALENRVQLARFIGQLAVQTGQREIAKRLREQREAREAAMAEPSAAEAAPTGAVTFVSGGSTAALSLAGIIDLTAERARLEKEIAVFDADIGHVNKKLGNPNFVSRAAPEVVDEQRAKLAEAEEGKVKLQAALARLDAMAGA